MDEARVTLRLVLGAHKTFQSKRCIDRVKTQAAQMTSQGPTLVATNASANCRRSSP